MSLSPETRALFQDAHALVAQALADGLAPDPELTVSEWADRYRILHSDYAAEPGRWRTDRTPYLREIMDELSVGSPTRHVAVRKAAQLGFTEALINLLLYIIDLGAGSALFIQPTEDVVKRTVEQRLEPALFSVERLRKKLPNFHTRTKGQRTTSKKFPGGMLFMAGANAPSKLRSMPARFILPDEVDGFDVSSGKEGTPSELAIKRANTFPNRKIYENSTPLLSETSRIDRLIQRSDDRRYLVPCPHCGAHQELVFNPDFADGGYKPHGRLVWDPRLPETAKYQCAHCEQLIDERHKPQMLAERSPDNPNGAYWHACGDPKAEVRGYSINALYAPLGWSPDWTEIARTFLESRKSREDFKTFVNTVLGQSWSERGQAPEAEVLFDRREHYRIGAVPEGALALTAACDVQKDRLEFEIKGWGPGLENWSIEWDRIFGDPEEPHVWSELERRVLAKRFPHELGGAIPVQQLAVDTGYLAHHVYNWTRTQDPRRVMAVKGASQTQTSWLSMAHSVDIDFKGRKIKNGAQLRIVDVSAIKSELYSWLSKSLPNKDNPDVPGACHFPEYPLEFFQGLTAEVLRITHDRFNREKRAWVKTTPGAANEPLDLAVYNRAATVRLRMEEWSDKDWDNLRAAAAETYNPPSRTAARPQRRVVKNRAGRGAD